MKRLTERYTNKGIAGVCLKALDYKGNIAESGLVLERLAEFEDFMEANKFDSIEELQNALNGEFEHIFDEKHRIWIKIVEDKTYVEKRNRILEEKWQNLKEWLSIKWFAESADLSLGDVIRKIKELEINE